MATVKWTELNGGSELSFHRVVRWLSQTLLVVDEVDDGQSCDVAQRHWDAGSWRA